MRWNSRHGGEYLCCVNPRRCFTFRLGSAYGFDAINRRFDDMRGLRRREPRRVEEVWGARLKHLEENERETKHTR